MQAPRKLYTYFLFDFALQDRDLWSCFKTYLQTARGEGYKRGEEAAWFLEEHQGYLKQYQTLSTISGSLAVKTAESDLRDTMGILITRYIKIGSSRELKITDTVRKKIIEYSEREDMPSKFLFDPIVTDITQQLKIAYESFTRTEQFEEYLSSILKPVNGAVQPHSPREKPTTEHTTFWAKLAPWRSNSETSSKNIGPLQEDNSEMKVVIQNLFEEVQKRNAVITSKDNIIQELRAQLERERNHRDHETHIPTSPSKESTVQEKSEVRVIKGNFGGTKHGQSRLKNAPVVVKHSRVVSAIKSTQFEQIPIEPIVEEENDLDSEEVIVTRKRNRGHTVIRKD
jgi:hypothetical protein